MSEHLDLDALAYLDEGLLDGTPEAPATRAHLAGCAVCQERLGELMAVRTELASVPPERGTPFDVVRRIDVALAAEVRLRGGEGVVPAAIGADRVPTVAARQTVVTQLPKRRWWPRLATIAASIVAVGSVGYIATQTLEQPTDTVASGNESAADAPATDTVRLFAATRQLASGDSLDAPEPLADAAQAQPTDAAGSELAPAPTAGAGAAERSGVTADALPADCGAQLQTDLGRRVLGATAFQLGSEQVVLVAVEGLSTDTVTGVVLPSCDSPADDALVSVEVPR